MRRSPDFAGLNGLGARRDGAADDPAAHLAGQLETAERVAKIGSMEWLPRSDARRWSANMYRILGLAPDEVTPSRDVLFEHVHPDDRDLALRFIESAGRIINPPPIELRVCRRTGGMCRVRFTAITVDSDTRGPTRIIGVVEDITDEHLIQRELAAHLALSNTLARWNDLDGLADVLCGLGRALGFVFGALWLPRDDALAPAVIWSEPGLDLDELASVTSVLRCAPGIALPGRAWRSKRPETLADVGQDEGSRRRQAASRLGLRGAVAFPALHSDEVIAVFEFYHHEDVEQIDRLTRTMLSLGCELGGFLSRRGGQLAALHLTQRQLDVLTLAAAGNTTRQIAAELRLGPATVRTHLDHAYEKLGVADRAAAVARAMRLGLIE